MRIRKKFLQLTSKTYPHGHEKELVKHLPTGYKIDEFGNYYLLIGENPTTMFTCHLDTADAKQKVVNHVFEYSGDIVKTDGKTILGADDKAGMVVILSLIESNVKGLYYFFLGEEVGCIGSKKLASKMKNENNTIKKVISFDRRGYSSIITHQWMGRCASDEFASHLSNEFLKFGMNMKADDTGVCTDSIQFQDFIPECTNISVGYYNEHTGKEFQNIRFLTRLCQTVVKIDWDSIPSFRDPKESEYEIEEQTFGSDYIINEEPIFNEDIFYILKDNKGAKKFYISEQWIEKEREKLSELLWTWGFDIDPDDIDWDGTNFTFDYDSGTLTTMNRFELYGIDKKFGQFHDKHFTQSLENKKVRTSKIVS